MKKANIVIKVHGGMVEDVYSDDPNIDVTILDMDTQDEEDYSKSIKFEKGLQEDLANGNLFLL